jgi:hypothetical protein
MTSYLTQDLNLARLAEMKNTAAKRRRTGSRRR